MSEHTIIEALKREAARLGYNLVPMPKLRSGGRKPTCDCGTCPKCKNRAAVASWRAKQKKEKRS